MAGQVPDPRTFDTWEDAFQYPLPVVRKLEQQLRKNIDENRQKLRSLVGASYRDLLGTAEKIIEMDEQVQTVEESLSEIGRKCNTRALERVGENHVRMRAVREGREQERYRAMAQTKVLQSSLTAVSRIMKAGEDALAAAKLLLLARLLHKSVSEGADPPAILEDLRRKLGALRRKLLGYIDRILLRPEAEKAVLGSTLCAYALVTSSGPKDALRHFLQARLAQIEPTADVASEAAVVQALDTYMRTLTQCRALFPRFFTEALSQLTKVPLLRDQQVLSRHELSLDIYEQWVADEVRTFTPWVRHEQILAADVNAGLAAWSTQVQACILDGVKFCIQAETDVRAMVSNRKRVLSKYLALATRYSDDDYTTVLQDVRKAFMDKLRSLVEERCHAGISTLDAIANTPVPKDGQAQSNLWQLAAEDIDIQRGAGRFRRDVLRKRHGRNPTLETVCNRLDGWVAEIDSLWELTQQMRSSRWDEEMDFDIDELPDGERLLDDISKQDPEDLRSSLRRATSAALRQMNEWTQLRSEKKSQAMILVRLLREIHRRQRTLSEGGYLDDTTIHRDTELVATLHRALAETVSESIIRRFAMKRLNFSNTPTSLWDGSPPMPMQPSPQTFQLLTSLHHEMADAGQDLWSPSAVKSLKTTLDQKLSKALSQAVLEAQVDPHPTVNGHSEHASGLDSAEEDRQPPLINSEHAAQSRKRDWQIQLLFDALYLLGITGGHGVGERGLDEVASKLAAQLELEKSSHERLRKSAIEYWKRTYLLFGLLAPGHS